MSDGRARLLEHLATQRRFLANSSVAFDEGDEDEAVRLAVALRVLLHDAGRSRSLLGQLEVKEQLEYVGISRGVDPRNLLPTMSLTRLELNRNETQTSVRYRPKLIDEELFQSTQRHTFSEWWTMPVIHDALGVDFSRKDLVLALAHKEGGAHVDDPEPPQRALMDENSLGWRLATSADPGSAVDIARSPVPASVRTIADELGATLTIQESLFQA